MRARTFLWIAPLSLGLALPLAAVGCSADGSSSFTSDGKKTAGDADGDGISNADEGSAEKLDSDGDGTPDYLDTDSDNDTLLDEVEAGDNDVETAPVDSDADGTPNFRDIDSDDNEIPDQVELDADLDGDGTGNYADPDNDGDGSMDETEIVGYFADCDDDGLVDPTGTPATPVDCDADGVPNYMDMDSDNDLIADRDESPDIDTDGDSFLDRYDADTDGDGFYDIEEAGDDDIYTAPIDTDGDLEPNFRDTDSDADGVSDHDEFTNGSDPTTDDTDGDGISDLIEVAAGTDPNDASDTPGTYGDFVFIVPYQEPTIPSEDTLEFRTNIQIADLYFMIDRTGSMNDEHKTLESVTYGVESIINTLECADSGVPCNIDSDCSSDQICFNPPGAPAGSCVEDPEVANGGDGCIPNLWTGVGHFEDCNEMRNTLHLQANPALTAASVDIGTGGGSEQVVQSAGCVADPLLCPTNSFPGGGICSADPSVTNPIGCPGYRPEAVRLLLHATDEGNQAGNSSSSSNAACGPGGANHTIQFAGDALAAADIKYVGLAGQSSTSGTPCADAIECTTMLGNASGTLDTNGDPFVVTGLNADTPLEQANFRDSIVQVVLEIAKTKPLYATIEAADEPNDAGDALQFLDYLEVNISGGSCTNVDKTADANGDGFEDAFPSLLGGTPVCWDVHPVLTQSSVPPTNEAQLFRATLTVYGDGSPLDSRGVYFLVPPIGVTVPAPPQ